MRSSSIHFRIRTWPASAAVFTLALAIFGAIRGTCQTGAPVAASTRPSAAVAAPATVTAPAVASEPGQGVGQIQSLLESLLRFDENGRVSGQKIGFELPERTINEYLAYVLRQKSRPGIASASVTLAGGAEVSAVAELDFNAVREWNPDLLPERFRPVFSGRQTVRLRARFESQNGSVTFTVNNAQGPNGINLPTAVVTALLQEIGRRQPEAFEIGKPITLPFGLKRVWIRGRTLCGET